MKTGLAILLPALILCCSCHKSNSAVSGGTGSWNIFDHEHIVNYSTRKDTAGMVLLTVQDTLPTAQNPFVNTLSVLFSSLPADSANFQVISLDEPAYPGSLSLASIQLSANQLCIFGTAINYTIYPFPWPDSCREYLFIASNRSSVNPIAPVGQAKVSVVGGKISVTLPMDVADAVDYCGNDSTFLYGQIQEK